MDVQKLDAKDKAHLEDEIEILKRLHHPGIIRLFDVYRSSTSVYIVQELCSGGRQAGRGEGGPGPSAEASEASLRRGRV